MTPDILGFKYRNRKFLVQPYRIRVGGVVRWKATVLIFCGSDEMRGFTAKRVASTPAGAIMGGLGLGTTWIDKFG